MAALRTHGQKNGLQSSDRRGICKNYGKSGSGRTWDWSEAIFGGSGPVSCDGQGKAHRKWANGCAGKLFRNDSRIIQGYYWSGSQWEWDGNSSGFTFTDSFTDDVSIRVYFKQEGSGTPRWHATCDNFYADGTAIWPAVLEDFSLDLSAYYQELENFKAFLRAHDGVELRDLSSALAAYNLSEEDISAWLAAYYEDKSNLSANLETWATHYGDLGSALDVKAQKLESLMVRFEAAKANFKDLASFLAVTDGSVFKDLAAFLSVTDGVTLKDCGLNLKVIQGVPAFRSITAQRVSSVVHEVS